MRNQPAGISMRVGSIAEAGVSDCVSVMTCPAVPTRVKFTSVDAGGLAMAEKKLKFTVKLEGEEDSSAAWMNAPFDVTEVFGTRARVPVRGTINGFPFRSSLMPMGGCHGMAVNKTMRDGAKAKAGDLVDVVMQRDEEQRTVEAP